MAVWAYTAEEHKEVVDAINRPVAILAPLSECVAVIQDQSNEVILTIVDDLLSCIDCQYLYTKWLEAQCRDHKDILYLPNIMN